MPSAGVPRTEGTTPRRRKQRPTSRVKRADLRPPRGGRGATPGTRADRVRPRGRDGRGMAGVGGSRRGLRSCDCFVCRCRGAWVRCVRPWCAREPSWVGERVGWGCGLGCACRIYCGVCLVCVLLCVGRRRWGSAALWDCSSRRLARLSQCRTPSKTVTRLRSPGSTTPLTPGGRDRGRRVESSVGGRRVFSVCVGVKWRREVRGPGPKGTTRHRHTNSALLPPTHPRMLHPASPVVSVSLSPAAGASVEFSRLSPSQLQGQQQQQSAAAARRASRSDLAHQRRQTRPIATR